MIPLAIEDQMEGFMSGKPSCRTKLIDDLPALKDEFGAHQRLADAIADLITSEEGGKSIGLEGGWGTGKSTIVRLLSESLEQDPNYKVVLFDAWAHQGDPLRRTFLESLIRQFEEKKWINEKTWEKKREELARRRKVTATRTFPQLGKLGNALAVGIILVPIGLTLLSAAINQGVTLNLFHGWATGAPPAWGLIVGLMLTINPLIIFSIVRIAVWLKARLSQQEPGPSDDISGWGAILTQRYVTDTQTESIETADPTSVEFEEVFTSLMNEALADPNHRSVLALDNLDRVAPSDALSILSTLQTFLQHGWNRQLLWFNRLWILISYDPQGIRRLWENESEGKVKVNDIATSFVDKSFQTRFEVPPLVLSDWHQYLITLLSEAYPDHGASEFHAVYRIFTIYRDDSRQAPSPRSLKLFVNQIGTIHRQWEDAFPLPQMAYYVLLRRRGKDVAEGLLKRQIPDQGLLNLLGDNSHDNLAAMAFNVDVPLARQHLLRDPLENALGQGDVQRLKELAGYPKGFWEILEDIPFKDWAVKESTRLANAAFCLSESSILERATPMVKTTVLRSIREAASVVNSWAPFDTDVAKGITALLRLIPDIQLVTIVLHAISASPISSESDDVDPARVSPWIDGLLLVVRDLQRLSLKQAYAAQKVGIPTGARGYINACAHIYTHDNSGEFWSILQARVSWDDISSALVGIVERGEFSRRFGEAIRVLRTTYPNVTWKTVVDAVYRRLAVSSIYTGIEISSLLAASWDLRNVEPPVDTALDTLSQMGHMGFILHHLYQANTVNDMEAIAWCMFSFLYKDPAVANPPVVGNSEAGYNLLVQMLSKPDEYKEVIDCFVNLLEAYDQLELVLRIHDATSIAKRWTVVCLHEVVQRKSVTALFRPDTTLQRWQLLRSELAEDKLDNLFKTLVMETDLITYVCGNPFNKDQAALYSAVARNGGAASHQFTDWCQAGLSSINTETWQAELQSEGGIVELVIALLRNDIEVVLEVSYQDALVEHGKSVMAGTVRPSYLINFWTELPRALVKSHARKMLRRRLCEAVEERDGEINDVFFDLYGDEIADPEILSDDDRIVSHLFTPLLMKRNVQGLEWLAAILEKHGSLLREYEPFDAVQDFCDRIRNAIKDNGKDDAAPHITRIAKALQIERAKPETAGERNGLGGLESEQETKT